MSFQVFPAKCQRSPRTKGPSVGIYGKVRSMRFNRQATEWLQSPTGNVLVWWDAELRKIAFSHFYGRIS